MLRCTIGRVCCSPAPAFVFLDCFKTQPQTLCALCVVLDGCMGLKVTVSFQFKHSFSSCEVAQPHFLCFIYITSEQVHSWLEQISYFRGFEQSVLDHSMLMQSIFLPHQNKVKSDCIKARLKIVFIIIYYL